MKKNRRKIFIDLGAYNGDSAEKALEIYNDFEKFYLFEPTKNNFLILKEKFGRDQRFLLYNSAVDIKNQEGVKLYYGDTYGEEGNSLLKEKINCDIEKFELVNTINFSDFLLKNFEKKDYLVLKIDIEGKEYEILEDMIESGAIKLINKIYCEWHFNRINMTIEEHRTYIKKFKKNNIKVVGNNKKDEFLLQAFKRDIFIKKLKGWLRN
ncbi:MAG: FkbM family methyltransferase [Patescibacteria group bacterium]|jgi:FkbM family methyltransferase|nr:FkbM family methyltransferase [Patescibacteria group bacterium]